MDIDGVLGETWRIYRGFAPRLVAIAGAVFAVVSLVGVVFSSYAGGGGLLLAFVAFALSVLGVNWLTGVLVEATVDLRDGRADLSVGTLFERVQPRLGRIIIAGFLAALGIAGGLVLLVVPGLVLLTMWCVVVPVIVLEDTPVGAAFSRSWALVRGRGWQVFGVLLAVFVLGMLATAVLNVVVGGVVPGAVGDWLGSVVANAVVAPFIAVAITVMYLRLVEARPAV